LEIAHVANFKVQFLSGAATHWSKTPDFFETHDYISTGDSCRTSLDWLRTLMKVSSVIWEKDKASLNATHSPPHYLVTYRHVIWLKLPVI